MAKSTANYGLYKYEGNDAPDLTKLSTSMDKIDTELKNNATNIGLLDNAGTVTWASTDRIWHQKPSGTYWVSGNGVDLGYPQNYVAIYHTQNLSGVAVQQAVGQAQFNRRFNSAQSMIWYKPDGTAV